MELVNKFEDYKSTFKLKDLLFHAIHLYKLLQMILKHKLVARRLKTLKSFYANIRESLHTAAEKII